MSSFDPTKHSSFLPFQDRKSGVTPPSLENMEEQISQHFLTWGIDPSDVTFRASLKPQDAADFQLGGKLYQGVHPLRAIADSIGSSYYESGLVKIEGRGVINATDIRNDLANNFTMLHSDVFFYMQQELMLSYLNKRPVGVSQDGDIFDVDDGLAKLFKKGKMLALDGENAKVVDIPEHKRKEFESYLLAWNRSHSQDVEYDLSAGFVRSAPEVKGRKVVIFGMGQVGLMTLHDMLSKGLLGARDTVVMADVREKAQGCLDDYRSMCNKFKVYPKVETVDSLDKSQYHKIDGADLVFVSCSKPFPRDRKITDRNWGLWGNAEIVRDIAQEVGTRAPNAKVVLDTNPIDVIVQYFVHHSNMPPQHIIGKSGDLDTERLREVIARRIFDKHQELMTEKGYEMLTVFDALQDLGSDCCLIGMHEADFMVAAVNPDANVLGRKISEWLSEEEISDAIFDAKKAGIYSSRKLEGRSPFIGASTANVTIATALWRQPAGVFVSAPMSPGVYQLPESLFEENPPFLSTWAMVGRDGVLSVGEVKHADKQEMERAATEQARQFKRLRAMDMVKDNSLDLVLDNQSIFHISERVNDGENSLLIAFEGLVAEENSEKLQVIKSALTDLFERKIPVDLETDKEGNPQFLLKCNKDNYESTVAALAVVEDYIKAKAAHLVKGPEPKAVTSQPFSQGQLVSLGKTAQQMGDESRS